MASDNIDDNDDLPSIGSNGVLDRLFRSCSADPRGSVHRAWGISLLFVVLYFALAIVESKYMRSMCSVGGCVDRLVWTRIV